MNHNEMQQIADKHNLGNIWFVEKIALNTGKPMEVGYVYVDGQKELFCKRSHNTEFYLCNRFRELNNV